MTLSRLAIATGGTGGHIFPALAVAAEAKKRNPRCKVLFFGGNGPETELAPKAGLEFIPLPAKGIMGKGLKGMLGSGWIIRATWQALGHLRHFRPQAVIGFGGYAGFCPLLAARLKNIPTAVHEQNSAPGATNRVLGKLVRRVFLSFADTHGAFPAHKCKLVGNPVRSEIFTPPSRAQGKGKNLLVLGGSQGAVAINDAVIQALPKLLDMGITLRHQTGPKHEANVRRAYQAAGADPDWATGFMDNMAEAYQWADLALCRAGASTVFELAASGTPAILVPFPHATHDHQTHNGRALEQVGAARMLEQEALTGKQLAHVVNTLFNAPDKLEQMRASAHGFAKPEAASSIMDDLETMTQQGEQRCQ